MSDPRFLPRDFCVDPSAFGKAEHIAWVTPNMADMHLLQAAKIQHFFAWRIRSELKRLGRPAKNYATFAHTSYDRLMKMLRGEVIMRLEDLGRAELYFGVESFVQLLVPSVDITGGPSRKSIG